MYPLLEFLYRSVSVSLASLDCIPSLLRSVSGSLDPMDGRMH